MSALLMPPALGDVGFINNLLSSLGVLVSLVPGLLQNGNSPLGLLPTPVLPPYLGGSQGIPWGERFANNTNVYEDPPPDTGVTREYFFDIARGNLAPDGIEIPLLLINGQFPGPLIEANYGDTIRVTMTNSIKEPAEGTALHWHGILQKKTGWYDGVPSVSMCPIAPGQTFVYEFQADIFGTSWYHSHYSAQYAGGLFGPMVIHGPTDNYPKDMGEVVDLGPVMLSDLIHRDYFEVVKQVMSNNPIIAALATSENTLIQGKMNTDCGKAPPGSNCTSQAGLAKFSFTRGKTHLLRFINTSAAGYMVVSIDGHDMTVVANDFVPIKPYTTKYITLFVGQRADVLVKANQRPGAYWMRVRQPSLCALSVQPFALGAIYYDGIDTTTKPNSLPSLDFLSPTLINCADRPLNQVEPYFPIPVRTATETHTIQITQAVNATGHTHYLMNGQTFFANYSQPVLYTTYSSPNPTYPPEANVYDLHSSYAVNIIFINNLPFAHPMHIHGQNMLILDEGVGTYPATNPIVRPSNPLRRDTATLRPNGYLAVQLHADNPGVWPFHCHIAWHVSQGLYINVIQKADEIRAKQGGMVGPIQESCQAWNKLQAGDVLPQIDSGLRKDRLRML